MAEREETTLDEVILRIREGKFYYDYDWASGPALRALDRAKTALETVWALASCANVAAPEHRDDLREIRVAAEKGLGR